jgi:hypothetical protein
MKTDIAFEVPDVILEETLLEQAYLVQEHITHLRKEIKRAEAFHRELLEQAQKQAIAEQGNFRLKTSVREVRTVIPHRFYELFPDEFYKLASIPVTKAEAAVGKARLADCIQTTVTETVKVEYVRRGPAR